MFAPWPEANVDKIGPHEKDELEPLPKEGEDFEE